MDYLLLALGADGRGSKLNRIPQVTQVLFNNSCLSFIKEPHPCVCSFWLGGTPSFPTGGNKTLGLKDCEIQAALIEDHSSHGMNIAEGSFSLF